MKSVAYNMDCVEGMKQIPDETIDMTITSPPYDNIRDYKGYSFDYKKTLDEIFRVTTRGGVCCWIVADQTVNGSETGTSFKQALYAKEIGFNIHDTMIWAKDTTAIPESTRYFQTFEYIFVLSKGSPKSFNPIQDRANKWRGTNVHGTYREKDGQTKRRGEKATETEISDYGTRFNVWDVSVEHNNQTGHPAVFPQKLVRDLMVSWSNEGDKILDPFLGSGTTRIVAYDNNREFVGYEISKEYFDKEEERFENHTAQLSLFIDGDIGES